ncbi:blue copper protein 1b-like [Cicer arietinum]|uniref:Cucumber peeling cupredoxin-like n=1 Tax=Cicer arietinum TaxID=3827 RepID=A0A1S2XXQ0_CICAR|nr:cucumber peeling cupredoxin-like [Cicer arietinum]
MLQLQNPFVLLLSSLFLTFLHHCSATQFIVGDSAGWVIPPYPTYYTNWTDSYFLREGDSLEFNFDTKFYNLIQVSQSEYEHCTALEPLKVFNSSPVNFPLKERGVYYFICSVSNYCTLGQKIKIYVHQSAPKISPTPSASPPQQKAPMISPQISPNGSVPQPSGSINPPPPSNVPSPTPGCPSSFQGKKFDIDVKLVCAMLGTFIGFWVM